MIIGFTQLAGRPIPPGGTAFRRFGIVNCSPTGEEGHGGRPGIFVCPSSLQKATGRETGSGTAGGRLWGYLAYAQNAYVNNGVNTVGSRSLEIRSARSSTPIPMDGTACLYPDRDPRPMSATDIVGATSAAPRPSGSPQEPSEESSAPTRRSRTSMWNRAGMPRKRLFTLVRD